MITTVAIITAIISYLVGSINTSIILSRSIYGTDIRKSGSGNAGATNMLRTHGKGMAVATLICDVLKGTLMVIVAIWLDNIFAPDTSTRLTYFEEAYLVGNLKYLAAIFVVLGHDFPIFFGFRGGKGVATSLGAVLALDPAVAGIMLLVALTIMICSRYVSLGSITAAAFYPLILLVKLLADGKNPMDNLPYIAMAFVLAVILILKHHSNIAKLLRGTENKLFAKKQENDDLEEAIDAETEIEEDEE